MSQAELVERLMATFLEELEGHIRSLSRGLVALQSTTSEIVRSDLIDSLLRTTHSLKGAAQSVRQEPLSRACHLLEEILIRLRETPGGMEADTDGVSLLLATTDAFAEAGSRLRNEDDLEGAKITNLLPRLEKLAAELQDGQDSLMSRGAEPEEPTLAEPLSETEGPAAPTRRTTNRITVADDPGLADDPGPADDPGTFGRLGSELAATIKEYAEGVEKLVDVDLSGVSLRLPQEIAAGLREPLRHLARNAVDHGIESPAERQSLGKPRRGRIEVSAALKGSDLEVIVGDDGRGLNLERLGEEARLLGIAIPAEEAGIADLAFEPGLSTSPIVTKRFGRGIGLDAVKGAVVALGGSVDVQTRLGQGARFTLRVPIPTAKTLVLIVRSGGQPFALHATSAQIVEMPEGQVRWVLGRPTFLLQDTRIPVSLLSSLLEKGSSEAGTEPSTSRSAVLLGGEEGQCLLAVDTVDGEQRLPITPFGDRFRHLPLFEGTATLESGELALVLATDFLSETAVEREGREARELRFAGQRALLIEESADARSRIEPILRSTGLDVVTALDDAEAIALLRQIRVDLVIVSAATRPADPAALLSSLEAAESSKGLPVVLLAHSGDPAFSRHTDLGVSALIRLSDFDEIRFVETMQRLMHRDLADRGEKNP